MSLNTKTRLTNLGSAEPCPLSQLALFSSTKRDTRSLVMPHQSRPLYVLFHIFVAHAQCSPANLKGKRKRTTVEEDFEEYELSSSESSDSSLAVIDNTKKLEVKKKGARTSQGKYKRPQAGVSLADCDFLLILIISSLEKHEAP